MERNDLKGGFYFQKMAALSDTNVPHPKRPRTSTFGVKILVERDSFGGNPEIIKKSLEDICKEAGCFINIDDYPGMFDDFQLKVEWIE